jgi:predicted secreted protein
MQQIWLTHLISTILIIALPLQAQEQTIHYDQISLQTHASQDIENDTLIAVMYAQREGPQLPPLTEQINRLIGKAVAQAKQAEKIKVTTLGYQTYPVYQKQRLSGWRVRQSIRLESRQNEALSQLLGQLQSQLALESISYTLSSERRQEMEEQLIVKAIDAFRHRAKQVTRQMQRRRYRMIEMVIQTDDHTHSPSPMRTEMMAFQSGGSKNQTPTLEGGTQTVRVEISGKIELQTQ